MHPALAEILDRLTEYADYLPPIEWLAENVDEIPYSPKIGRPELTPWQREVYLALTDPMTRAVSIVAAVQTGKTLAPELALAYIIANEPGPALWLDLTDASARDQSETRLRALFENTRGVKKIFSPDKNKMRLRTMFFQNGMTLWVAGAKNKRNLQRRSIRYVFGDETWLWDAGRMAEAEARASAFKNNSLVCFMSQAGNLGDDTDRAFRAGTCEEWHFRCPHCGNFFAPTLETLRWDSFKTSDGKRDFPAIAASVRLECPHCAVSFAESTEARERLNENGRFIAENPAAEAGRRSFHWNAICAQDWSALVLEYLRAKDTAANGDCADLRTFYQKRLALPWNDGDELDENTVETSVPEGNYKMREHWEQGAFFHPETARIVPAKFRGDFPPDALVPLMFLSVDVQADYMFWVLRRWDEKGNSRLFDCGVCQTFDDLAAVAQGSHIFPRFVLVDCGFRPESVYRACAQNNWTALRGSPKTEWTFNGGKLRSPVSAVERVAVGNGQFARRIYFSNLRVKDILHALRAGRTASLWSVPLDAPRNYIKMLSAERRDNEKNIWEQIARRPNHYFDCETMNLSGAILLGIVG